MPDLSIAPTKATFRRRILEGLVRTLRVVVADPLIQSLLRHLQIPEHLPRVELDPEGAVKALDLARGGRRAWLGEDVIDAVLAADAVEEDLDRRLGKAAGEDLAVVGQDLCRYAVFAQGRTEAVAHRLGTLREHEPSRDAEPGVVVDASQSLGRRAISEREAVHDVHLPELHGCAPLPTFPGLSSPAPTHRVDDGSPHQAAIDRGLRGRRLDALASQLERDPSRSPVGVGPAHLEHHHLHFRRHLVRAVGRPAGSIAQPLQALALIARQPTVHRLTRHAPLACHLTDDPTGGDDSLNRFVPLLTHAHLPHARGVSRRYRSSCSKPAEGLSRSSRRRLSPSSRTYTGLPGAE